MFTIFGGAHDYILVGTRNSLVNNVFYALNINNGDVLWKYDGTADGKQIGMINAQASVDYPTRRVYFTSYGRAPNNDAVWCLDLDTGGLVWAAGFGSDVPGSPIARGNHVYVGALDGTVRALRTSDGGVDWTYTPGVPDGVVKAFVFPDRLGTRLFFSTTNTVWAIQDNGGTASLVWSRNDLQSPSTPVFIPGGPHLYVGTGGPGNGKLYRLSAANGSTVDSFPLGDLAAQIGSPTLDLSMGFLYVGSDAGVVYAIQLP
jgi:outer membrane protein assembly factor BamB